jgi:hypothetical protein
MLREDYGLISNHTNFSTLFRPLQAHQKNDLHAGCGKNTLCDQATKGAG